MTELGEPVGHIWRAVTIDLQQGGQRLGRRCPLGHGRPVRAPLLKGEAVESCGLGLA